MARWTAQDIPDQTGRTALVTGANSGLGLETATALAAHGARVLMACRNQEKAAGALSGVRAAAAGPTPEVVPLDLADLASVRAASEALLDKGEALDLLVNNAGVMALPLRRTPQGFEMQFGTNHLGHFALTGRLLPLLRRPASSRVVTLSSAMHRIGRMRWEDLSWTSGYHKWPAYGQSKLANLLFMSELDRRATAHRGARSGGGLVSVAAHPGYASTHLQAAGPEMGGNRLAGSMMNMANSVFAQSAEQGARPSLYAATMPDVQGGAFYGPDGPGEMRGYPKEVQPNGRARNEADAARLWTISEELTEVTFDWSAA
ncbi:MAG: oxidoreductase [Actinomycetota bacterium]|nr:oxidoreductase [Actinomycetota bacterium]